MAVAAVGVARVDQARAARAASVVAVAAVVAAAPPVHSAVQVAHHAGARSPSVRSVMSSKSSRSMR